MHNWNPLVILTMSLFIISPGILVQFWLDSYPVHLKFYCSFKIYLVKFHQLLVQFCSGLNPDYVQFYFSLVQFWSGFILVEPLNPF